MYGELLDNYDCETIGAVALKEHNLHEFFVEHRAGSRRI